MAGIGQLDYRPYLKVCREAVYSSAEFNTFRHHPIYADIVGGISYENGLECIPEIKKKFGNNKVLLKKFAEGDSIGHPMVYFYEEIGLHLSPSTLRYIRTLIELLKMFGDLDSLNIVEIGSGYGGQCKVIHDLVKPKSYTLIDLPEALALSRRYLEHFGIDVTYRSNRDSSIIQYDLCISNYSYSEIEESEQLFYNLIIINNSEKGYMICNNLTSSEYMLTLKKSGVILPEVPLTCVDNYLYVWG